MKRNDVGLEELVDAGWILSSTGMILRHKYHLVFRRPGINAPTNIVETTEIPVITSLLQQTDFLHLMSIDIERHYMQFGELAILPVRLPFKMRSFGIFMRRNGGTFSCREQFPTAPARYRSRSALNLS